MFIKKIFLATILMMFLRNEALALSNDLEFKKDFDETELNIFMDIWPDYLKWSKKNKKETSDLNEKTNEYPKKVIKWIEKRDFAVDRFFYLEERINLAIRSCLIKDEQLKISSALKLNLQKVIESPENPLITETLKEEIKKSETAHLVFGITEQELAIICPNVSSIEAIMLGK